MTELFLKVVNMSISAGWLVLAILVARLFLKKAPKWIHVMLWGIAGIRLLCPFSPESILSLIPSAETIPPTIMTDKTPQIHSGISVLNSAVNPVIGTAFSPAPGDSANPLQIWLPVLCGIWLLGMTAMAVYAAVSYLGLRRRVATAIRMEDNIYRTEQITSPFVLGIFRPVIYLPVTVNHEDSFHVIAHEKAHIRRRDHWWKPLGFLLLTLHWFHPLMWLGYILLCRDIELACDEKVIKDLGTDQRADYSQALLMCGVSRRSIAACPLAFGEVGIKQRIKNVLHYKKPALYLLILAFILCASIAVCFLTDPLRDFSAELPQYTPLEALPKTYSLQQAKLDGCVVMEDGDITSGEDIWQTFIAATKKRQPASVRYVNYSTIGPSSKYSSDLYESIKNNYPRMFVHDLTYDGWRYTDRYYYYTQEYVQTYRYLMHFTGKAESRYATYQSYDRYVLTDRNDVTWADIITSILSSSSWRHIDHLSVYVDLIYKDAPSDLELQTAADSLLAQKEEFGIGSITVDTERQCLHITASRFSDALYDFISRYIPLDHVHISLIDG